MDALKLKEGLKSNVVRNRELENHFKLEGKYVVEHIRGGKVIGTYEGKNLIVNVGKDYILNTMFASASQITAWYIGLVDNASWTAFAAADTMSSHAGWIENTAYSDSTRVAWGTATTTSQSMTNASPATFNINGTATIKGIFVTSGSAKSGTSGTLWNGVAFSGTIAVSNGDQLKVTYTVNT